MRKLLAFPVVLLVAALFVPAARGQDEDEDQPKKKAQRITLSVEGVECARCSRVLTATMTKVDLNVSGRMRPNTKGPSQVIATCPANCDLAACAAQVNKAETPHREKQAPGLCLVLFAELDQDSAETVQGAFEDVEAIDTEACKCNVDKGEIHIKLTGKGKITLEQIVSELEDNGIEAQLVKPRRT